MADAWGQRPLFIAAVALAAGLAASGYFLAIEGGSIAFPVVVSAGAMLAAMTMPLVSHHRSTTPMSVLVTACIVMFIGGALFNASFLAGHPNGSESIIFLLAVTFSADTGAYAVGRTIGSRKLAPSVSPGKTWEGAIGGLAAACLAGAILTIVLGSGVQWIVVAGLLGVTGQLGDLYVSKLKRQAGFNDSGAIFPGHGGMLDRLDSLSFNLIVVGLTGVAVL